MGRKLNALLEVILVFVLIVGTSFFYTFIPKQFFFWPVNAMIAHVVPVAIILVLLALTTRKFSLFGISMPKPDVDLKVVSVWVIPLCVLNMLGASSWLSDTGKALGGIALFAVIELVIIYAMMRLSKNEPNKEDKLAAGARMIIPAAAIGSLIIIPAMFLPTVTDDWIRSINLFVVSFVFVGLGEELVFRGYIQSKLNEVFDRKYKFLGVNWGAGLIIASLLFGLVHIFNGFDPFAGKYGLNIFLGVIGALMGLILGFVREKTSSIGAASVLHGAFDFFGFFFV